MCYSLRMKKVRLWFEITVGDGEKMGTGREISDADVTPPAVFQAFMDAGCAALKEIFGQEYGFPMPMPTIERVATKDQGATGGLDPDPPDPGLRPSLPKA